MAINTIRPTYGGRLEQRTGGSKIMSCGRPAAYHIRCFIHPWQNLYQLSYVYVGICDLASQNIATVEFRQPASSASYALDPVALWAEVTDTKTGEERRIVFETSDHSSLLVKDALKACDLYFKRSYYAPDLDHISLDLKDKVAPLGLVYACRTAESIWRTMSCLLPAWVSDVVRSPAETIRKLLRWELQGFLRSPDVRAFEHPPDLPVKPSVHFQTYIWDSIAPDSPEQVNRPRVELTRLLKKEFGPTFHGGIVPTEGARPYCPDEVSAQPTRRSTYVAQSKQMMIGIYTRGLHHSTAFKLPEYLASSKCIVAQPVRNQLPTPLLAGRNYLEFSSPEECVECCKQILKDQDLAAQMRKDNWDYYQREVRPDRRIAYCLNQVFRKPPSAEKRELKVSPTEERAGEAA